jgi:hypothetical protein
MGCQQQLLALANVKGVCISKLLSSELERPSSHANVVAMKLCIDIVREEESKKNSWTTYYLQFLSLALNE